MSLSPLTSWFPCWGPSSLSGAWCKAKCLSVGDWTEAWHSWDWAFIPDSQSLLGSQKKKDRKREKKRDKTLIDHFSQIRYKKILLAQENSSLIKVWEGLKTRGGNEQVKQVNNMFCQGLNLIWIKGEGSNKVWVYLIIIRFEQIKNICTVTNRINKRFFKYRFFN